MEDTRTKPQFHLNDVLVSESGYQAIVVGAFYQGNSWMYITKEDSFYSPKDGESYLLESHYKNYQANEIFKKLY